MPVNIWGTLAKTGQHDDFSFTAKKGHTIVFDLNAIRLASKAKSPRLEILDAAHQMLAANNGLDSGADPFLAFTAPRDGDYTVRVLEITLEGSPEHVYRLTAGHLPYVTGWWPLSVPANQESQVHLVGHNLKNGHRFRQGGRRWGDHAATRLRRLPQPGQYACRGQQTSRDDRAGAK